MKMKNIVAVLIVGFILASCAPTFNVVPTETAIPAFTPTITITPLPTITSTPDYTPTPTPIPQAWLNSVKEFEGELDPVQEIEGKGWIIEGVTFDPATLFEFLLDHEPGYELEPRFGAEGEGQVSLRCYGEIQLPNGEKVITGFTWFQQRYQRQLEDGNLYWFGTNYMTGAGLFGDSGGPTGMGFCKNVINRFISAGRYHTSFTLVTLQEKETSTREKLLNPLLLELAPPVEFWQTGNISLLPTVDGKSFLFATHFVFLENK